MLRRGRLLIAATKEARSTRFSGGRWFSMGEHISLENLDFIDQTGSGEFLLHLAELDEVHFSAIIPKLETLSLAAESDLSEVEFLEVLFRLRSAESATVENRIAVVSLLRTCIDKVGTGGKHKARRVVGRLEQLMELWKSPLSSFPIR